MISRKHRFRGRRSLDYVYKRGKTIKAGPMSLKYAPSKNDDYRLAVVVSKKVSKSAVKRNRIRRRLYEQLRIIRADYGQPVKYDLILTAFDESLATMPADKLSEACRKLVAAIK